MPGAVMVAKGRRGGCGRGWGWAERKALGPLLLWAIDAWVTLRYVTLRVCCDACDMGVGQLDRF